MILENFNDNHSKQNNLRGLVGLPHRKVAEFNNFFDFRKLKNALGYLDYSIIDQSNFSSLHDVLQDVIVPMMLDGETDYDHDLMRALTKLQLNE